MNIALRSSLLKALVACILCVLSACATVITPSELSKPKIRQTAVLSIEYYEMSGKLGVYQTEQRNALAAGVYVSEFEDAGGVFFRGPQGCLSTEIVSANSTIVPVGAKFYAEGGIYVPHDKSAPVRSYFYRGSTSQKSPSTVDLTLATASNQALVSAPPSVGSGVGVGVGAAIAGAMAEMDRGTIGFSALGTETKALRDFVEVRTGE